MNSPQRINLEGFFSAMLEERKDLRTFYKIAQRWEAFAGEAFGRLTHPVKFLQSDKTHGVLLVAVPNSTVASQFYYSKAEIISKIALHLGYPAVSDIKTVVKAATISYKQR